MSAAATVAPVWVTSRAAGIGALLAASLGTSLGLASALRPAWLRRRRPEAHAAHEALGLATLALLAVHGLALLADPVLGLGLAGLLLPFAGAYRPFATGLGQLAAAGFAALSLGYYARRRIGARRWRAAHRAMPIAWALAVLHGLLAGSDAGRWWFLLAAGLPALVAVVLVALRHGAAAPAGAGARARL